MNSSISTVSGRLKLKMVLLGCQSVGKSCIIERYVNDRFDDTANVMQPTVGIDFLAKEVTIGNKTYRLQIWDTAGQQRFKSLIPRYLRDAHCSLIVFDVSSKATLNSAETWLHLYNDNKTGDGFTILVGNKIDLVNERQVSDEEGRSKAEELGLMYFEVSAKTGQNLDDLFEKIVGICNETHSLGFKCGKKESHISHESEAAQEEMKQGKIDHNQSQGRITLKKEKEKAKQRKNCC